MATMYDYDVRLAEEMLRIAYETHDGEEIYAARRYLKEVRRSAAIDPWDDTDDDE